MFFDYVTATSKGTKMPRGDKDAILKYNIKYPSLIEQRKIANILSTIDDKIQTNKQINENLQSLAQLLFKHWFIDFEFPNEEGLPYKSSGGEMVDSELGMIPIGWEVIALDDICYFNNGTITGRDDYDYINYLDTSNITENKIDMIQKIDFKSETVPSRAKRKVKEDSIVYSTVRPNQLHYGIIKKPVENMIVSTGFVVIDSKFDYLKNDLIYLWLTQNEITTKLQGIAETSTSTYPSIKPSDIKFLKVILPTDKEALYDISNTFSRINLYIAALQEESKNLSNLRDTLLPKLMSGEIDLSNLQL
jgi:type I restriction enzyme S subunit